MAYKRKNHLNHSDSPYRKRFRPQSPDHDDEGSSTTRNETQARVDPTYGQRGAFPGLDDSNGEDELFYGPASDGLEYLRMVRSEARTVPNLLVAPSQSQARHESNGLDGRGGDDTRGHYADGAYTTTNLIPTAGRTPRRGGGSPDDDVEEEDADPQEAYYAALCTRFLRLRRLLHSAPAHLELPSNDESAALAASLYGAPHSRWRRTFLYTTPSMRVLGQLEQESVIYGLQVMETLITKRNLLGGKEGKNLGAWCWGLLGRCREVGEMMSEEVSVLRNVGKKALVLRRKLRRREAEEEGEGKDEEVEHWEEAENEGVAEDTLTSGNMLVGSREDSGTNENSNDENRLGDIHTVNEVNQVRQSPKPAISTPPPTDPLHQAKLDLLTRLSNPSPSSLPNTLQTSTDPAPTPLPKTEPILSAAPPQGSGQTIPHPDGESQRLGEAYAALDMIVTVVGEMYGQRDLLEMREVWGEV